MNNPLTLLLLATVFVGDLLLVRLLWLWKRREGEAARTAGWLFFTGAGVVGLALDGALLGRHPFVAVGAALASGYALALLGSWAVRRAAVHEPRTAMHNQRA